MTPTEGLLIALAIILVPVIFALAKDAYMAAMLLAANVGMFIFVNFVVPGGMAGALVFAELALNPRLLASGKVYTLFTSMFLQITPMHLLFNVIFLLFWGSALESRVGPKRLLLTYIATGLAAGLIYSLLHWNSFRFALGASGALFGIAGCFVALYPKERMSIIILFIPLRNVKGYVIIFVMLFIEIFLALAYSSSGIAHEAHLGGLFAGLILGSVLSKHMPQRHPQQVILSIDALVPLATTPTQKDMLHHISGSQEPEIIKAWTESFLEKSHCPVCGKSLGQNDPWKALQGTIKCSCGWRS